MSATGSNYVSIDPYGITAGVFHRGLGDSLPTPEVSTPDYGLEARQSALARQTQEARNQAYDQQAAARSAQERAQILQMAQTAVDRAQVSQTNILTSGSNSFRKFLFTGGSLAAFSIFAIVVVALTGKPGKRDRSRRSRRSAKRRKVSRRSASSGRRSVSRGRPISPVPSSAEGMVIS